MAKSSKKISRRFSEQIFSKGDLTLIRRFVSSTALHPGAEQLSTPEWRSAQWFADLVDHFRPSFPDLRVEIQDQLAENARVVTCLRMRGTQTGPLLGIRASGKAMDITGVRVDRLVAGAIAESWIHCRLQPA